MYNAPKLHELITRLNKHDFRGRIAIFDPGETTGFACFQRTAEVTVLLGCQQIPTWPIESGYLELQKVLDEYRPSRVLYEAYHVYKWRLEEHTFSEVPTIQIIGALKLLLLQRGIPYSNQTAQVGKGFCTDDKLKYWDLYMPGKVHARDAIRHGCHFLLFGQQESKLKGKTGTLIVDEELPDNK
jgi:hypothetical protein